MTTIYVASESNRWNHRRKCYQMGCWAQRLEKTKNTPKLGTEKIHSQRYQCICSFFSSVIWDTCVCQAGCWTWWVFDLNQRNLNRCLVVGEEEEHRWECQLWVQKDGYLEELVLVSLVCLCFYWQLWGSGGCLKTEISPKQNLPCSACGHPVSSLTCWRCLGRKDTKKKNVTNAKRFADCTRVEIHRSSIITSILSPNLILCKVILGVGIA